MTSLKFHLYINIQTSQLQYITQYIDSIQYIDNISSLSIIFPYFQRVELKLVLTKIEMLDRHIPPSCLFIL